jgi:hypothetical protein
VPVVNEELLIGSSVLLPKIGSDRNGMAGGRAGLTTIILERRLFF